MAETIKKIDFQQEQNKNLVIETQHDLLKQENEKRGNNAENAGIDNSPLHPNDLHMIENNYKAELANVGDEKNANEFLKPFFVARDMGFLDALLYKQPFTVTDEAGNNRSLAFKEPLPHSELQSFVQSMNGVQDWKTQFVEKVKEYVQGTLAVDQLPTKKSESVQSKSIDESKNLFSKNTEKNSDEKLKTPSVDVKQEVYNKYGLTSKNGPEQAKKNAEYFVGREKQMIKDVSAELKKLNKSLPENVLNNLGKGLTERWSEKVRIDFTVLEGQSSNGLPKSKLLDMLNVSPFDQEMVQKHGMSHENPINKINDIVANQDKVKNFTASEFKRLLSTHYSGINGRSDTSINGLITEINTNKKLLENVESKKSLQGFVDAFESARSDSQTETFMRSATPALEKAGVAISQFGDGINQLFDGLKKSGVWDEIAKICELLFGTGSLEDKLKRFNEIKETEMTLNQSWALNKGFNLRETKHKDHAKEPLDQYGISLKKELPGVLFGSDNKLQESLSKDDKQYQAFMQAFKEQTKWVSTSDPSLDTMIVWAHGTPAQKQSIHSGNDVAEGDIAGVIGIKVDTIYKRATDEKWDKAKNPNESFSRALIASLITPPKDSLRVARGVMKADQSTKETTDVEKNLDNSIFRDSLELKQENGKLKVETNPSHENRKIQINGKDTTYDKTNGIEIKPEDSISIINTQEDNVKKRGVDAIKVENITLLTPKFDTKTEGKVKLGGLVDDKDYTATILNDKNQPIGVEGQPLKSGKERELPIDKEKTPSYLILKQDDNGVKQRIAFPKKEESEVKK